MAGLFGEPDKYYIEVIFGKELQTFSNCTYLNNTEYTSLTIITSDGKHVSFVGNFSAKIIDMKDYQK